MAPWLVVCGWSGCGFQVRSVHGDGVAEGVEDADGNTKARLLDLVPGRSGKAYSDWLEERGEDFRDGIEVATLDPFHGYKNAIDDQLEDATAVLDAFHMVKLGTHAVDEVRRRVQQPPTSSHGANLPVGRTGPRGQSADHAPPAQITPICASAAGPD